VTVEEPDFSKSKFRKIHAVMPGALRAAWEMLSWQARGLYRLLVTEVDRDGRLELGPPGLVGLCGIARASRSDWPQLEPAVTDLLASGLVTFGSDGVLALAWFRLSQETPTEASLRKAAYRKEKDAKKTEKDVSGMSQDNPAASKDKEGQAGTNTGQKVDIPADKRSEIRDLKSFAEGTSPPAPVEPIKPRAQLALVPDLPKAKPVKQPKKPATETPTASAWAAYAEGYRKRYGADPVRNAKVNGQLSSLVKDYGGDAERLVAFYLARDGQNYTRDYHPMWALLRDAQKLHTEMRTGRAAADPPPAWRPPEKAKPYRPPYFDPVVPMKFNRLPPTPEEEAAAREALHALRERTAPTEAPPEGQP
jgi:hypothetical protein